MYEQRFTRRSFLSRLNKLAGGAATASIVGAGRAVSAAGQPSHVPRLQGKVLVQGSPEYEQRRLNAVWQGIKPSRYPALIAQARSEADIVEALRHAQVRSLPIGIVGSGHNYVGTGLRDGGLLLDLSALSEVEIDPVSRRALLQPGIKAGEFNAKLAAHDLAFPIAHNPDVGMGGYLLGGGMGWNAESWSGLACFNVRAVDVITVAGERISASAENHPDLFWAARGAGPAFCAVATRFHVDVFARPPAIAASAHIYPIAAVEAVITWLDGYRARQPAHVEIVLIFAHGDKSGAGGDAEQQCIVSAVCFADTPGETKAQLDILAQGAPTQGAIFTEVDRPTTIEELLVQDLASVPLRHCVDTLWLEGSAAPVRELARQFQRTPSRHTLVYTNYRARPVLAGDGAYSVMAPLFVFSAAAWVEPEADAANQRWADEMVAALAPYTVGGYINETEYIRRPERARGCFSEANWLRLQQVNARYDPGHLLRAPFLA